MQPTTLAFCVLATRNYVARARTLLDSLRLFHPEATCYLLLADATAPPVEETGLDGVSVLWPNDVMDHRMFWDRVARYGAAKFSVSMKPALMRYALERGHDTVLYLDADTLALHPFDSAVAALARDPILLSPHVIFPLPVDDHTPSDRTLLRSGIYNGGFLGVRESEAARRFLDWWDARVHQQHLIDVSGVNLFGDQIWLSLVPSLFEGVTVLRDPGYNVANWNLSERHLTWRDGTYYANEQPLVFFHFSRFDPYEPTNWLLRKRRPLSQPSPALDMLFNDYANQLLANGYAHDQTVQNGLQQFSDGTPFDARAQALLLEALESNGVFPSPLDVHSEPSFITWLDSPAPEAVVDGHGPHLTRYVWQFLQERPDLREVFPDARGQHRGDFLRWLAVHHKDSELPMRFVRTVLSKEQAPPGPLQTVRRLAQLSPAVLAKGTWMGNSPRGGLAMPAKRLITGLARMYCRFRPQSRTGL